MLEISGLAPIKTRSRRPSARSVVCAGGDFFSRLIVPLAFSAARMAVAEGAAAIRDREQLAPVRYRRSKQQEAAVATLMTFIHPGDEAMNLYPLIKTVVARGREGFSHVSLNEALGFLHDLGILRVWRSGEGLATGKRRRVVVADNVKGIIAALPERFLWKAARIVMDLPFARSAFGRADDLHDYVMAERAKWSPLPQAPLADFVIAQCSELSVLEVSRGHRSDPAGEVQSRRIAVLGKPVPGWEGLSGLPPYSDHTPGPSTEGPLKELGRPMRDCVAADDFVDEEELTTAVKCEHAHEVTRSRGNEMTNLTGRPILTKDEQIAQDRLRRQNAKTARAAETTSRAHADMEPASGPSETVVAAMRKDVAEKGYDVERFEGFLQQMSTYGWRGKTQKQVDASVMKWYTERADGGSFRAQQKPQAGNVTMDYRAVYASLCGNADTEKWADRIEKAGLGTYLEDAMTSSLLVAQEHFKSMDNPAWTGMKRIGSHLGSTSYLFHIAGAEVIGDEVIVHVLHPMAQPNSEVMATQAHADVVARVVAAVSGLKVKGVPSDRAWVRMGERELVHERPF